MIINKIVFVLLLAVAIYDRVKGNTASAAYFLALASLNLPFIIMEKNK